MANRVTSTKEYFDHSNFTGYAQTIVETTKNAAGQATKRIGYTFGTDEITQTTVTYDSSGVASPATSLTFGHDAHGSVRVLFDALGALSQAFTYAAYGELLAIHNGLAQAVGTIGASGLEAQALTNSGESFDSRIGKQYLRVRWYQTEIGRFARLDPFAGIADDPLAINKYLYAHSKPISGDDPNGKFFALVGVFVASSISNQMRGADAKASSAIARNGSAFFIDLMLLDSSRALSRIINLAAKPVRGLTRNEKSVLEFIHRSARPSENRTAITKTLRD